MDEELKQYLYGMAADIARKLTEMESRIISALKSPELRAAAVPEKLESGKELPVAKIECIRGEA
jgi:hypothetical protein